MLPLVCAAAASMQVMNGWFALREVSHLVPARPPASPTRLYGNLEAFEGVARATATPAFVVLAATDEGMHAFLHDDHRVCRCCWAGDPTLLEKVTITTQTMQWLLRVHKPIDHRVYRHEDGHVLRLARLALGLRDDSNEDGLARS
jgi:hypothetical protein